MAVACLNLPGFVLQAHARRAPHLVGTSFAVATLGFDARVIACSQPALQAGVSVGIPAERARALGAEIVDHDPRARAAAIDDVIAAVRDVVGGEGGAEPFVEDGRPGSLFVDVPREAPLTQALVAARLIGATESIGFRARVGIASTRFVAWAATQAHPRKPVRVIPIGAEEKFLAPLGLDLLPLDESVRHTLATLGVRTLGDFASLPSPSVTRRSAAWGSSLQALARGQ